MKNFFKVFSKKINLLIIFIILISSLFFNLNVSKSYASLGDNVDQSFQGINNLSDSKVGLLTCDPNASQDNPSSCNPKDAILLGVKLFQIVIYIIVIALILVLIIGGIGYVYNGKNPGYLNKWKKYIKNSVYALLIIIFGIGLVLALLSAFGFKSDVLNFIKGIFANLNFQLIPHSYAQTISSITEKSNNGEYTNFFPGQTVIGIVLTAIKFFINYIAAPALIGGAIWAGVLFVGAQGNTDKLLKAKKFAMRVAIGIAVAAAAYSGVSIFLNSLNDVAKETGTQTITTSTSQNLKSGEACKANATNDNEKCGDGLSCKDSKGAVVTDTQSGTCQ